MVDGVLVIKVPKVEVEHVKREVHISGSDSPSPVRGEKQPITAPAAAAPASKPVTEQSKGKEIVAEMDVDNDNDAARSETEKGDDEMAYEDPVEELPKYKEELQHQDDEADEDDDEGEYVKIDVK